MIYKLKNGRPQFAISTFEVDGKPYTVWTDNDITDFTARFSAAIVTPCEQPSEKLLAVLQGQTFKNKSDLGEYITKYQDGTLPLTTDQKIDAVAETVAAILGGN